MKKTTPILLASSVLIIVTLTATGTFINNKKQDQKLVSEFGKYQGYTQKYTMVTHGLPIFWRFDGTRLAYDVSPNEEAFRPSSHSRYCSVHLWTDMDIFDEGQEQSGPIGCLKWYEDLLLRVYDPGCT
jgi:hypothetical protein